MSVAADAASLGQHLGGLHRLVDGHPDFTDSVQGPLAQPLLHPGRVFEDDQPLPVVLNEETVAVQLHSGSNFGPTVPDHRAQPFEAGLGGDPPLVRALVCKQCSKLTFCIGYS